jgi:hypothetical protein
MLKNATKPFGVVDGTRSSAADRMMTYKTDRQPAARYDRYKQLTIVQ